MEIKMRVKKIIKKSFISVLAVLCISCATSNNIVQGNDATIKPKKNFFKNEFVNQINNISIESVDVPKETIKGRPFKSSFKSIVKDLEGNPVANFPIQIKYPTSKENGKLIFSNMQLFSLDDGSISFMPETVDFSCNSVISISPAIPANVNFENEAVKNAVKNKTLEQSFKIKSDIVNKGAVLFIWDFNEKGRPTSNSYTILSELRKKGVSLIGNAPVSDTSYIGKPLKELYEANFEYIGANMYGYLLYGTVKFEVPVTKVEDGDGYTCTLVADIYGISMKDGETVLHTTATTTALGSNWNYCVSNCKNELTTKIVEQIIYGL